MSEVRQSLMSLAEWAPRLTESYLDTMSELSKLSDDDFRALEREGEACVEQLRAIIWMCACLSADLQRCTRFLAETREKAGGPLSHNGWRGDA